MVQSAKRATIIGGGVLGAQCALILAQLGVEVGIITPFMELASDDASSGNNGAEQLLRVRPLLLRAASHPRVSLYANTKVELLASRRGEYIIRAVKNPRYVRQDLCTSCGRCSEACSVEVPFRYKGKWLRHNAIHAPLLGVNAVPSAYSIDKTGIAPCTSGCPLGINVQGFVSLLAQGKVDKALALINEVAPLAGVLGRVCTHLCEEACKRAEVDAAVFVRALHRYAADNASPGIRYKRKARAGSRREKIAIVGSGPAGLACAWELARRGYTPTVFESHAVVGGMLATGIPRFRLPREVREMEVKAILDMGVEVRTGVTIGRDVAIPDLRERGYRAFFVAIGAQENRELNIPGADLEGVVDGISLLFELNLRVGASVGRNMVVIGGGNCAVDSARAARRRGRRNVTILCITEEMTAVKEDVEEALNEGISIEYLTSPVEILGDGTRVTGLRCQRVKLGDAGADGCLGPIPMPGSKFVWPVPVPGSEFIMEADHVVLAIGQRPSSALLTKKKLELNDDATIIVDPVTLMSSVPDVFAAGDCVTGPNSVVDAVAGGLRGAESIDRFLRGRSLTKGERAERPHPVEVNVADRYASPYKRADMPFIPRTQRMGTFEETSLGLPPWVAEREAGRCLSCALCSGCLECEEACELDAVFHDDCPEKIDLHADAIIEFVSDDSSSLGDLLDLAGKAGSTPRSGTGVYSIQAGEDADLWSKLARASSVAMQVASYLELRGGSQQVGAEASSKIGVESHGTGLEEAPATAKEARTAVILCSCGGSISSVIDFAEVSRQAVCLEGVFSVQQIFQACTECGAQQIAAHANTWQVDRVVVAACRCCNQDQICFSCTDRRILCRQYLDECVDMPSGMTFDFVNVREQCAWVHQDEPESATQKAVDMISAAVDPGKTFAPVARQERILDGGVLVIGTGLCALAAAKNLTDQGCSVALVSAPIPGVRRRRQKAQYLERKNDLQQQVQEQGTEIRPWPESLDFNGYPGGYEIVLEYGSEMACIRAAVVILVLEESGDKAYSALSAGLGQSLIGRILSHRTRFRGPEDAEPDSLRSITVGETAGVFITSSRDVESPEEQIIKGEAAAAKAWAYLAQGMVRPRANVVAVKERLCRGCGDCTAVCPYIEMRPSSSGFECAYVDPVLCLGCGACIARCPTGAIGQPLQGEDQLTSMLGALLGKTRVLSEV